MTLVEQPDVIVVGMGAAALAAAIEAHDAGSRVLVLEKAPREHAGGNSRVSGQLWLSPTDAIAARRHLRAMSGGLPPADDVVDAWAEETSRNSAWIQDRLDETLGRVPRDEGDPYPADAGEAVRVEYGDFRGYTGNGDEPQFEYWEVDGNECGTQANMIGGSLGFSRLWLTLRASAESRGIEVRYDAEVSALVLDESGAVAGVEVRSDPEPATILARRAVVLATSGFAASPELTRRYLHLPDAIPWGSPYNTGDGLRAAQRIGADLDHPYNYMGQPGIRLGERRVGEGAQVAGDRAIFVGADGRRFMDETRGTRHGKTDVGGRFDFFPGAPMWTVFDEDGLRTGPLVYPRSVFPVGWLKQTERSEWSPDSSAEIEAGWIVRADTVEELASRLGIDAEGLVAEVAAYNRAAASGAPDPRFGRAPDRMHAISRPPFYGYAWGQLLITTLGGLRKDGAARVVDVDGRPIPRLFAAGDVASSYTWLLSGGMALGDALAFGRLAGRGAVALPPRPAG